MADEDWYERLSRFKFKCSPPVKKLPQLELRGFGPYEAAGGEWKFSNGFQVRLPTKAGEPQPEMYAMKTGDIQFKGGSTPQAAGSLLLIPGNASDHAIARELGILPRWYPLESYIEYTNVDSTSAKEAAKIALNDEKTRTRALKRVTSYYKDFSPSNSQIINELADIWFTGTWKGRPPENSSQKRIWVKIPVEGGKFIGRIASSTSSQRWEAEVTMILRSSPRTYLNPAYYLARWLDLGWLDEQELLPEMTELGGPPSGTGRLLFISAKTGVNTGSFDTPANPSQTISGALAKGQPGDTLLILDQETYPEAVIIDKPLSLISKGKKSAKLPAPDYPVIDGNGNFRPVTFRSIQDGIAHIGKLIIRDGRATGDREDGGGILVEKADNVVISNCVISKCVAPGAGYFAEGFGGGIATYHASPAIIGCRIESNRAEGRGCGVGVFGFGWPAIYDCLIQSNSPLAGGSDNARPDGGGVGVEIAVAEAEDRDMFREATKLTLKSYFSEEKLKDAGWKYVRIIRSTIRNNAAYDDGGGIYITTSSAVWIRKTDVLSNQANRDGGGLRVTMNGKLLMIGCNVKNNASNATAQTNDSMWKYGGGGISCRNASLLQLYDVNLTGNEAKGWAGGGLYFISTDEGEIEVPDIFIFEPDFDWNDILLSVYNFKEARFLMNRGCKVEGNSATYLVGQGANHGKGGGLYFLRWRGNRRDPDVTPRPIIGRPLLIHIEDVSSIGQNSGDFVDEIGKRIAERLWLEDMVAQTGGSSTILKDIDLPKAGAFVYPK